RPPPERAAVELRLRARILRAAPGADRERAAERVEAEQRVRSGDQIDRGDRRSRDQVPVHGIAEGLVDAHAVLVHRDPLRRAEQRRGGEAPVADIGLEGIALYL